LTQLTRDGPQGSRSRSSCCRRRSAASAAPAGVRARASRAGADRGRACDVCSVSRRGGRHSRRSRWAARACRRAAADPPRGPRPGSSAASCAMPQAIQPMVIGCGRPMQQLHACDANAGIGASCAAAAGRGKSSLVCWRKRILNPRKASATAALRGGSTGVMRRCARRRSAGGRVGARAGLREPGMCLRDPRSPVYARPAQACTSSELRARRNDRMAA
jgi:hypothetical protein